MKVGLSGHQQSSSSSIEPEIKARSNLYVNFSYKSKTDCYIKEIVIKFAD